MRFLTVALGLTIAALSSTVTPAFAASCPMAGAVTAPPEDWLACIDPLFEAAMTDVRILSADDMEGRAPATTGSDRARAYIIERLTAIGVEPLFSGFEHHFTFDNDDEETDGMNVVAMIPGTGSDPKLIVLTAHYDHLGVRRNEIYNGADDNASGVAALLAIASVLKQSPPAHTVVFAFVDAEEIGFHGSLQLVRDRTFPLADVALNINLDMVSKGVDGALFAMGGYINSSVRGLINSLPVLAPVRLVQAHDNEDDEEFPDWTNESDQFAFHRRGIPWLYFANDEHAEYHKPEDDFGTVQPEFFKAAITTALAAVRIADAQLSSILPADRVERDRDDDD
jgi:Zn-dependent M28 family amino/carboxypeptidase